MKSPTDIASRPPDETVSKFILAQNLVEWRILAKFFASSLTFGACKKNGKAV